MIKNLETDWDKELEVIDIERKGNLVRFYLGKKEGEWGYTNPNFKGYNGKTPDWLKPSDTYYGDDWNESPYEYNAGSVYEWFVKGYIDIAFAFDCCILEPIAPAVDRSYSKEDIVDRKIPTLIILPEDYRIPNEYYKQDEDGRYKATFDFYNELNDERVAKIYFGDKLTKLLEIAGKNDIRRNKNG